MNIIVYGKLNASTKEIYDSLSPLFSVQLFCGDAKELPELADIVKPKALIFNLDGISSNMSPVMKHISERYYGEMLFAVLNAPDNSDKFRTATSEKTPDSAEKAETSEADDAVEENGHKTDDGFIYIDDPRPVKMLKELLSAKLLPAEKKIVKKNILLVDDGKIYQQKVKSILGELYNVEFASTVAAAKAKVAKKKPHLILLDYMLEKGNGLEFFEYMSSDSELDRIPVVFVTELRDSEIIRRICKYMPEGYLLKPYNKSDLLETVKNALSHKANRTFRAMKEAVKEETGKNE